MSLMVTSERAAEYQGIVQSVTAWAEEQHDIAGVATVGSWARHEPRMDSDLDLVVLTVDKERYQTATWWVPEAVGRQGKIVRTQGWGRLTERPGGAAIRVRDRVRLRRSSLGQHRSPGRSRVARRARRLPAAL